jgi:hypothetical protein
MLNNIEAFLIAHQGLNELLRTFFPGVTALVLFVGGFVAILNLKTIIRNQQMAALQRFSDELAETEEDRKFIYRTFQRKEDYSDLNDESRNKAERVINFLNKVEWLIENRILPPRNILSLCHTVIIRCWYQLEPFAKYQEQRIGGRYGRRIARLDSRAKQFHDIRPHQRINAIRLDQGSKGSIVIYETDRLNHFRGVIQRIRWWIKYSLGRY